MWYAFDNVTGNSVSLKTRVKAEAESKVAAMNETERQPSISLGLAKVYLNATDPKLATRPWQEVMEHIVAKKKDETKHRWETAIKDANFDCLRKLHAAETRPEHFDRALADGKGSTNVHLRRIHNHALGMTDWSKPRTERNKIYEQRGDSHGDGDLGGKGSSCAPAVRTGGEAIELLDR